MAAPSQATKEAVGSWLRDNGLNATTISPAGDWIAISVPVDKANSLFNANFSTFKHQDSGKQVVRTLSYALPNSLQGHVDVVHPTVTYVRSIIVGWGAVFDSLTPRRLCGCTGSRSRPT